MAPRAWAASSTSSGSTRCVGEHKLQFALAWRPSGMCCGEFQSTSWETLGGYLGDNVLAAVGEYERTEAGFVRAATAFAELKADFVTAKAASNSDRMVDWLQMRKGDKATFLELVTNAMEALKTPIFPLCFASRIPKDRQEAGDYILVEPSYAAHWPFSGYGANN